LVHNFTRAIRFGGKGVHEMAEFYLVRHGQTAWNKDARFRGRKDVPLSEQGAKEAEAVADALEGAGITGIYASPLSRAVQTLAPLAARLGLEVVPLEEVIDMNFGEWEGMAVADVQKEYPGLFETWKRAPHQVDFPGGERLDLVQARAMRGISRLSLEHPKEPVAVCSHRVVCKLIILGLFGAKADRFWSVRQDTACINLFHYNPPDAVIHKVNDTSHLSALGGTLRQDF